MTCLRTYFATTLVLTALLLAGCGDGGPTRYPISGVVTFKGEPVEQGTIAFEPLDESKGNGGHATIIDGKYNTNGGGKGHLGGPHKITIVGFTDQFIQKGNPDSGAKPLFPKHVIASQDLQTNSTADFDVP